MNLKLIDLGILILRVSFGLVMMAAHGLPKLKKLLSGEQIKFFDPFGIGEYASFVLALGAEFFASLLLTLGIFTKISTFSLSVTMFVAAFLYHTNDPFNVKEKPILFLIAYVVLFLTGPGKYSLQNFVNKRLNIRNNKLKFLLS
jgi:putative oxidoreductase